MYPPIWTTFLKSIDSQLTGQRSETTAPPLRATASLIATIT
jgi:hypothetical protein